LVQLKPGERIILQEEKVNMDYINQQDFEYDEYPSQRHEYGGTLTLTNLRLIFEDRDGVMFREILLSWLKNVWTKEKGMWKWKKKILEIRWGPRDWQRATFYVRKGGEWESKLKP